jgi:glycosyltransferase involved in cell wall biosynthesis
VRVVLDVSAVPARPAGAGQYNLRLAAELGRRDDVELAMVSTKGDGGRWRAIAPDAEVAAWVPERRPLRLAWEQARGRWAAKHLRGDLWHGPHYTMPFAPGVPAVVTIHDLTFFDHPEWHERWKVAFFQRAIRMSVRRAAVLVAVSDATERRLHELLRPSVPVVSAPHGVDTDRFCPTGDPSVDSAADAARLAALGVREPFVAFVGTIEPRKNVAGLVRAMEALPPEHQLVLAGQDGWGVDEVDRAIAASTTEIVRLGYVDDDVVPALYRRSAAVAYPALEEGFGMPALEALACGAPVVTTSGTPMADMLGEAAVLVPPGDDAALGEGLLLAVEGRGPSPELGPRLAARHSWAACAEGHVAAYRLALARS